MKTKISDHYTYHRGPMAAVLACNHCKHSIVVRGDNFGYSGIIAKTKGEIGDHIRREHPEVLTKE
jgi:hypothetical protein